MTGTRQAASAFLLSLAAAALAWGFAANGYGVASADWFRLHQRDMESFVLGRMAQSRQGGLFSYGGLLGAGTASRLPEADRTVHTLSSAQLDLQEAAYLYGERFDGYLPYLSQVGGQGLVLGVLDRFLPGPPAVRLAAFRLGTALLSGLALALVAAWVRRETGWIAAAAVLVTTALSPWLTVFGRNLWWQLWSFYVPMLAVAAALERAPVGSARHGRTLAGFAFAGVLVKCAFSGYEYVTTALVMAAVPLVFAAVRHRTPLRLLARSAAALVSASAAAGALSLGVLCLQVGAVAGSPAAGPSHVAYALAKRTHGNPEALPALYEASLRYPTSAVVRTYAEGTFADLHVYGSPTNASLSRLLTVRYSHLLVLFLGASALLLLLARRGRAADGGEQWRRALALVAATWFSILAPLSWFVVFKAHSIIHTHMNFVAWQMPFTLLGFGVCGSLAAHAAAAARQALSGPGGPSPRAGAPPPPRTP